MAGNIMCGARYVVEGFRLIVKPGVRRFFLVPLSINVFVFGLLTWLGIDQFGALLNWFLPGGEEWWAVLARVVMWIFFAASALVILFFTFTMVANFIGAPFNGLLAEKVEELISGTKTHQESIGMYRIIADIPPAMFNEVRKLIYHLIVIGLTFTLSFIPVINVVSPFIWIVVTSWMMSLEYMSYPMENHGIGFKEVRARLKEKRIMCLGFGFAVMTATLIPMVNFFIMPASVAGATVMWVEQWKGKA